MSPRLFLCCRTVCVAVVGGLLCCGAVAQLPEAPSAAQAAAQTAAVSGTVKDVGGTAVSGARVRLQASDAPLGGETTTDADGRFRFGDLVPGQFVLTVTEEGLATETETVVLREGQALELPVIVLRIATANTDVNVSYTREELAEQEIHLEEKQRLLGVLPNFFVVYQKNAVPLTAKQKFKLAGRGVIDPTFFVAAGIVAGIEQANNDLPGYGTDAAAYGERYGAALANGVTAVMFREAVFPALLHQDERYYYKGTGKWWARAGYAVSTAFICKGDNGKWQPNYSSVLGNLSAGALTNAYYPPGSRNGVSTTIDSALIATAGVGFAHLMQEFVFGKVTTHRHDKLPDAAPAKVAGTDKPQP